VTTLVTGGNGWVPSHVVKRLADRGETVVSYDLMEPDDLFLELVGASVERVTWEQGDVTDRGRLAEVAARHGVDAVVHMAAITPRPERERREPDRIVAVNLGGTVNALEVARALPVCRRFVHVSSGAVWGEVTSAAVLDELSPANATGLYGVTKLAGERVALRYAELFGLNIVAVRPANVYGPMERDTPGYVGATQLREMLRVWAAGETIKVNSLDGPFLDWTWVGDIAEGIERIWAVPSVPHRLYVLSCGQTYGIGDVLRIWTELLPDLRYELVDEADANVVVSGGPPGPVPSNARLRADLDWAPATPIREGMRRYLDWIAAHGPQ
jgi:nucleoside-diphosphate-sugar epimerase